MADTPIQVRDADASELEIIRYITLAAYREFEEIFSATFWEHYRQDILDTLDDKNPAIEHIVAEQDGLIRGSVLFFPPGTNAYPDVMAEVAGIPEIRLLAVLPTMRGQGIGKLLMDECLRRTRQHGAQVLGLHTLDGMRAAIHIYKRMGFVRVPSADLIAVDGTPVVAYRLYLGSAEE